MDDGHKWTEEELRKLERRISAEYTQAEKEMQAKLEKYMADFARKDQVKRAQVSQGKITQSEYLTWRKNQLLVGERWKEMRDNLAQDMHTTNMKTASMTRQFSYEAYAMNFNYGVFETEKQINMDTSFTLYDRYTVERLIRDDPDMLPPPGKKVSQRIREGKDVLWNKQQIQSVMTQSILQGESIPKIAERLAKEVGDKNKNAAIRNARTMTTGAENAGRVDSYVRAEKMGIQMEQMWVATLDNRTRHEHRQLDGMKVKVGQPFVINNQQIMFPGDPHAAPHLVYNCRCTLIGVVKNSNVEQYKRNMEAEGNIKGNPDMTYDEWKNQHMGKQKNIPAPAPIVPEKSWQDKIQDIVNSGKGIGDAEIMQAGKIMQEQIAPLQQQYANDYRTLSENIKKYKNESDDYFDRTNSLERLYNLTKRDAERYGNNPIDEMTLKSIQYSAEKLGITISDTDNFKTILEKLSTAEHDCYSAYKTAREKYNECYAKRDNLKSDYRQNLKAKYSEIREMGISNIPNGKALLDEHLNKSRSPVKKYIVQAYDYYPTEWIAESIDYGRLTPKKVDRGYYSHWRQEIAISGWDDDERLATAIHELGHRFERTQVLTDYEKEFYERRTAGESLQWLGSGYGSDEKTRFDNFISPYMGKDYGGSAYELCSMGFEYAYTKPEELAKDPDMEAWILGILAVG